MFASCGKRCLGLKSQLLTTILIQRHNSSSTLQSCKVLIVGGGSGGIPMAAKLARKFNKKNEICLLEPSEQHYYQPFFTLVGAGAKTLPQTCKETSTLIPNHTNWIKQRAQEFDPKNNIVITDKGVKIKYDFLIVALGIQPDYGKIPGLKEALDSSDSGVSTIYDKKYVEKCLKTFKDFESGNAIFTYPNSFVKCPGAPQKIMYLCDHYFTKKGKRNKANIIYNTNLPVLFGVKVYADALWKVVKRKQINVNLKTNLIEINPGKKEAIFEQGDDKKKITMPYSLMHVTPPLMTPDCLKNCTELTNAGHLLDVNKDTLQHVKYPNVFGIGDCTSTPNSKTGAAVARQSYVLHQNLLSVMEGKSLTKTYEGYASCPLVTGYGTCIMAEFDYDLNPLETLPIRQDKEMFISYLIKKEVLPVIYWQAMLKGYWNGPTTIRKLLHLQFNQLFKN